MNLDHLKNKIAIVGVGYTPQGKVPGRTAISFHCEAVANAIADAGISKNEIDALYAYRHFDALAGDFDLTGYALAEQLGIRPAVISQEYFCTRGWLYEAIGLLTSGLARYFVISYGDNARSGRRSFVKELKDGKSTDDLAVFGDLSTMAKYAMQARRAMDTYGTGPDVWKEISLAQRDWAQLNPIVVIRGFGSANQPVSPYRLRVEDAESAAYLASRQAFDMAGVTPADIDACEFYDCFTYTVEATLRDYGFFKKEQVRDFITRERLAPGGSLPVNTSGGMLSEAYFMGLTPLAESFMQLTGRCGDRQLGKLAGTKEPALIACSDNGAVFQGHAAMILERGE